MEFTPSSDANRAGGEGLHVSPSHANALLRSAMAISAELIGTAFPVMTRALLDQTGGKWDNDAGAPLVQRHLMARASELHRTFVARLPEIQDQYLNELTAARS